MDISLYKDYDETVVNIYLNYVKELKEKKKLNEKKQWVIANDWALKKDDKWYLDKFIKIMQSGLQFDGKHISLDTNGVRYDYIAYKNKMLLAYPETLLDMALVYKGDDFMVEKDSGDVIYKHIINNPFDRADDKIIGGYAIIKNKRGNFLTTLTKADIEKCKKVSKTGNVWREWFAEMALKTVIKKAVKIHFDDIYKEIEEEDNKNYDLEKDLDSEPKKTLTDKPMQEFLKLLEKAKGIEALPDLEGLKDAFQQADAADRRKIYVNVNKIIKDNTKPEGKDND